MLKSRHALFALILGLSLAPPACAFSPALNASAAPAPITIPISAFTYDNRNGCFNGGSSVGCSTDGAAFGTFSIPVAGYYSISQPTSLSFGTVPYFALFIDNVILDHGIDANTGSDYVFDQINDPDPKVVPSKYLRPGNHIYTIAPLLTAAAQINFSPPTLTFIPAQNPPTQPAGSRDPTIQPLSSNSIWNTSIGSGATWCLTTDADCKRLNAETGVVNAGSFSEVIYAAAPTDPLININVVFNGVPTLPMSLTTAWSTNFVPASGSDHNMVVYNATHDTMYDGYNCGIVFGPYQVGCSPMVPESVCDGLDPGAVLGGIPGMMRKSEVAAGVYNHRLSYQLSKDALLPPTLMWQIQWPEYILDGCDTGCYTGIISPGVTLGIPLTVNLSSIGLTSADGAGVARAIQRFGMGTRATGGTSQLTIMCEQACDDGTLTTQMANIRTDVANAIVPVLAIMRNQSSTSINGGGTYSISPVGRINTSICPYPQ